MTDRLDAQILHALQLSPRVSFRRIAAVATASEQTVARRYRALCRTGALRVIGVVNPQVHGDAQWVARIHAKPDHIPRLADALVQRPEVTHANTLSGWTELVCVISAPIAEAPEGLLRQLPRTAAVLDIGIDLVLHVFGRPETSPWTGRGPKLTAEQVGEILGDSAAPAPTGELLTPTAQDRPLLDALAEDGRAAQSLLAERTGWSVARVARRLAALETAGTLLYDVDLLPEHLGYHLHAMVWLKVTPAHLHGVGEQIAAHEEVAFAGAVSGRSNLLAVVTCRDVADLYRYLIEKLAVIDHIDSYDVSIRAQRLKQSGSVIAHGRLVNAPRVPPTPRRRAEPRGFVGMPEREANWARSR